jgi:hypothetical protein
MPFFELDTVDFGTAILNGSFFESELHNFQNGLESEDKSRLK